MQLREIMKKKRDIITCNPTDSVTDAAKKMKDCKVGCILIAENGSLKGIVTDRDITLSVVAKGMNPGEVRLKEIMNTPVVTGKPEWDLLETTRMMAQKKIRRLPIQSNGKLEGFVSTADLAPIFRKEMDSFLEVESSAVV